ncbi:MAG: hypothetical protein ACLSVD_10960 [Eggerthellaceae bacterium]
MISLVGGPRLVKRVPVWLDIAGVVFGGWPYTGALLGVCKTFPLWNNSCLSCSSYRPCLPARRGAASASSGMLTSSTAWACSKFHFCLPVIELC